MHFDSFLVKSVSKGHIGDVLSASDRFAPSIQNLLNTSWGVHSAWSRHELPTRYFPTMQDVAYALSDLALHWHGLDMCIQILVAFDCLLCTGKWLQLNNRPQPDKRSADNSVPSNSFVGYQVYSSTCSKNSADHEITKPGAHWPRCEYCNRKTRCFGYCNLCAGRPCSRWCELVTQDTHYCPEALAL